MRPEAWRPRTRFAAGLTSGLLLFLTFPPTGQRWLGPVALVPFLLALRGARAREAFLAGGALGAAFYAALMSWISLFGFLALTVLAGAAFVFLGAWAAVASVVAARGTWWRLGALPVMWAGFEVLYTRWPVGGLGWGVLGASQHSGGTMLPLARLAGVTALGMAVFAVNALLAEAVATARGGGARWVGLGMGALGLVLLPGFLPMGVVAPAGSLDVAAVQGNVPADRFRGFGRVGRVGPEDTVIIDNHLRVTERLLDGPAPELIVWAENAFDRDPRTHPELFDPVRDLVRRIGAPLVLPAILDAGRGFTNSNLLLTPQGEVSARYDKIHLVPFGEYVPIGFARTLVPALRVELPFDGVAGEQVVPFTLADGTVVGTMICFESTYAWYARDLARAGAQVLVVNTNNASFQRSAASAQHLALTRLRAVETGRAVVHTAISGISAIIAPDGTVLERSELFTEDVLRAAVPLSEGQTPATRYGSLIELIIALLAGALSLTALARAALARRGSAA